MPELTLSWVSDLSDPDQRGNRYVNVAFEEWNDTAYAGKKDQDAAIELHGLLTEHIGRLMNFQLEDTGRKNKKGAPKHKILGFGTPGGADVYTAPQARGGGSGADPSLVARNGRLPEHDAAIRAAVALKAAANFLANDPNAQDMNVIRVAEYFDTWLAKKASEPASSAYGDGAATADTDLPSRAVQEQAGVSSEDSADSTPADREGVAFGEGVAPSHTHDYQLRQGVRGFLVCDCGKTIKKATE